jgi:hypothetical protein
MKRVLFIVDRNARRLLAYVRDTFAGTEDEIEVIEDRRSGDRRAEGQPPNIDRRQHDRRKDDVSSDLKRFGWALVRRREEAGRDEAGSDGDRTP